MVVAKARPPVTPHTHTCTQKFDSDSTSRPSSSFGTAHIHFRTDGQQRHRASVATAASCPPPRFETTDRMLRLKRARTYMSIYRLDAGRARRSYSEQHLTPLHQHRQAHNVDLADLSSKTILSFCKGRASKGINSFIPYPTPASAQAEPSPRLDCADCLQRTWASPPALKKSAHTLPDHRRSLLLPKYTLVLTSGESHTCFSPSLS